MTDPTVCCATCAWYSEDDDGDGHGCCPILLNDPEARGWRTLPSHSCDQWLPSAEVVG